MRCFCWAAYFHFLGSADYYPPQCMARALGYNNAAIALLGACGPYLLSRHVAASSAEEETRVYLHIKAALAASTLLMLAFPGYLLWNRAQKRARR